MATLALSVAGQFVGGLVGGPIGAMAGRALGALAGSAVDNALFGEKPREAAGSDLQIQGSVEGGAIPRLYGWNRVSGNIIWATELEEIGGEGGGAKGMGRSEDETAVAANFAVGLCLGEVQRLGRIWADGKLLETEGLTIRFYRGSESQAVDSLIEGKQGEGNTPAYRGLCYLVFEKLPLAQFGNRIPNIAVELCRAVGQLEPAIRSVTVIPGATEFGYDPEARVRLVGPGQTVAENTHLSAQVSDWTLSIDELQALLPNLDHVSLVVAWFGDDLRCGECTIAPRVEGAGRAVRGAEWSVAGLARDEARIVSMHDGGPAYGGTPSDASVVAAIADLKARGLKVTLYPLVMTDIPEGNGLADPYSGGGDQPAYPWRGRITCMPAPQRSGSPDGSDDVLEGIEAFVGNGSDWRYRRMIGHYAQMARDAGADGLIIGSELRGMTTLRDGSDGFPFVTALVDLAAEAREIAGSGVTLTYAADWSEFSGYQPDGAKYFHLDPLWASDDIDAVGIDSYMPTTDWRDGDDHADAAIAGSIYERDYIESGIAGGEGYDWFYGSDADRVAGLRSAIGDGAYGEPWVWRFKDILGWWSNAHHDRPGGVRSETATAWVPKSKPIWFTELGCGAVDKGANQPNVFADPKSSEDGRPYFSSGQPDPLMQRQFLRAHFEYWTRAGEHNPVSGIYGGRMLDPARITVWTWDARPYPAFPADTDSWSDGPNHATGHWLTGRAGTMASDELIAAIAGDFGVAVSEAAPALPLVHGLKVDGLATAREALDSVLAVSGLTVRARPEGLDFVVVTGRDAAPITEVVAEDGALVTRKRPDPGEALGRLALTYFDRERGYLTGTVTAMRLDGGASGGEAGNMVLDLGGARHAAERLLAERGAAAETVETVLPPSLLALEPGDAIALEDGPPHAVTEIRDGAARRVTARTIAPVQVAAIVSDRPQVLAVGPAPQSDPVVVAAQLPALPGEPLRSRLVFAASAQPWPGEVAINDDVIGARLAVLTGRAAMGGLDTAFSPAPFGDWDDVNVLRVRLYSGHLASASEAAVRAGSNRLAVQNDVGDWEIVGFADAELVAANVYELTHLLRGLDGSDFAIGECTAGNRVFVPDSRSKSVAVDALWLGGALALTAFAGRADVSGAPLSVVVGLGPVLPLAPSGLSAVRGDGDDIVFTWTRRSHADPNGFSANAPALDFAPEAYRLTIFNAATPVRSIEVSQPTATYTAAQQAADFGALPEAFDFNIAQVSMQFGAGHAAKGAFHE